VNYYRQIICDDFCEVFVDLRNLIIGLLGFPKLPLYRRIGEFHIAVHVVVLHELPGLLKLL
jgi:hypothetical protein